jgi:hypothetical protein
LVAEPVAAKPSPVPTCAWKGDPVDPFTGKDGRYVVADHVLRVPGSWGGAIFKFYPASGGTVSFDLELNELGVNEKKVERPLLILLSDASVVEVQLQEPDAAEHRASAGSSAYTSHHLKGTVPTEALQRIAELGATKIRYPLTKADFTLDLAAGPMKEFNSAVLCARGG